MPPTAALHNWVRRKLGVKNEKQIRSTAFAIATAIKERGIAASPYLERAINQASAEFDF